MTSTLRVIDSGLMAARANVAMTAALVELHAHGAIADTLRLHRYPVSVLLGHGQPAPRGADLAYCRAQSIEIARRVTGGGAVFMTPRMLAWDVVVGRERLGGELARFTARICEGIAGELSSLGAAARFRPPNDIEIGGRKLSGSSGYVEGSSAVLQGTILIEDDTATMAAALRIRAADLADRVTSLAGHLHTTPGLERVSNCVVSGIATALAYEPHYDAVTEIEFAACRAHLDEIGSDAFVFGGKDQADLGTAA